MSASPDPILAGFESALADFELDASLSSWTSYDSEDEMVERHMSTLREHDEIKDWLIAKCNNYLALHQHRSSGRIPSYNDSERLFADIGRAFPDIESDVWEYALLSFWEQDVFQAWMLAPQHFKADMKPLEDDDVLALLQAHYRIAMADRNMTEFVVGIMGSDRTWTPRGLLRAVLYLTAQKSHAPVDELTFAFNYPAADDAVRFVLDSIRTHTNST